MYCVTQYIICTVLQSVSYVLCYRVRHTHCVTEYIICSLTGIMKEQCWWVNMQAALVLRRRYLQDTLLGSSLAKHSWCTVQSLSNITSRWENSATGCQVMWFNNRICNNEHPFTNCIATPCTQLGHSSTTCLLMKQPQNKLTLQGKQFITVSCYDNRLYEVNLDHLLFFISNLIHCFSVYVQYLLSSFLYMFQASQAHHQEV